MSDAFNKYIFLTGWSSGVPGRLIYLNDSDFSLSHLQEVDICLFNGAILSHSVSPDGSRLIVVSTDNLGTRLHVINISIGSIVDTVADNNLTCAKFHPQSGDILVGYLNELKRFAASNVDSLSSATPAWNASDPGMDFNWKSIGFLPGGNEVLCVSSTYSNDTEVQNIRLYDWTDNTLIHGWYLRGRVPDSRHLWFSESGDKAYILFNFGYFAHIDLDHSLWTLTLSSQISQPRNAAFCYPQHGHIYLAGDASTSCVRRNLPGATGGGAFVSGFLRSYYSSQRCARKAGDVVDFVLRSGNYPTYDDRVDGRFETLKKDPDTSVYTLATKYLRTIIEVDAGIPPLTGGYENVVDVMASPVPPPPPVEVDGGDFEVSTTLNGDARKLSVSSSLSGELSLLGDPYLVAANVSAGALQPIVNLSANVLRFGEWAILPSITGALSAKITGVSIQGELPSFEGNLYSGATLNAELPSLEGTLTAQVERKADIAATLPMFTGQMSTGARISATMPKLAGSTTALVERTASVSATMPRLSGSLDGTTEAVGNIAATLPIFTGEMFGTREEAGSIAATLPRMSGSLDALTDQTFGITGTLPMLSGRLTAGRTIDHDLIATMPRLSGFLAASVPQEWAVLRHTLGVFR